MRTMNCMKLILKTTKEEIMAESFTRTCIKRYLSEGASQIREGETCITSKVRKDGNVVVFSHHEWPIVPINIFDMTERDSDVYR